MSVSIGLIFTSIFLALGMGGGDGASLALPIDSVQASMRFMAVDLLIDPHGRPLAAYQVQVVAKQPDVTLVGVEGGEHPAFSAAPYYDRRANLGRRIVIAAYNTGNVLPTTKTRVATIMIRATGKETPTFTPALQVAASSDTKPITADVSVVIAGSEGAK